MSPARRAQIVNAFLIVTALVLVGIVVGTAGSVTTNEREARSFNVLAAYREDEISRVRVERPNESFTLERESAEDGGTSDWIIKAPYEEDADLFAMQSALGTLEFASWVRRIKPEEVNRAAFGLDSPSLVIHVDMGDIHYRLRLGKEAASPPGSHYLEVTGEGAPRKGIVLIDKNLVEELHFKAQDFRGRYVMPYLTPSLVAFAVKGTGGDRRFKRAAWDGWRFDGMYDDTRVNREVLDRILVQFSRTVVDEFIDPKLAESLQKDAEFVTVSMVPEENGAKGEVIIGGACPDVPQSIVARRTKPDELAGCVPANVFSGLATPAGALVDRTLFHMRPDEVEVLSIQQGERQLELARKGEGFTMRKPRQGEVDGEAGNARLEAMWGATGRVVDNPNLDELGLAKPAGKITISSAAADDSAVQTETVYLSAPAKDGSVYVRREHDGVVLELAREAARALEPDASLVRSRILFDLPIFQMRRVAIAGKLEQIIERAESGDYTLVTPEGFEVDSLLATEILDALRTLTAERWVADSNDGSFGLEQPSLTVTFTTRKDEQKPVEHTFSVGRPTASGYYAQLAGDPGVFVLPRRVQEVLTTLAIDRSVFSLDSDVTTQITLKTPEKTVVLERLGDLFVQSSGEKLEPATIRRIVDGLSVLRAEAAVSLGPSKQEFGLEAPLLTVEAEMEPGLGARSKPVRYRIGSGDSWRGIAVHYARLAEGDATYVLPRSAVQTILDAL